jgi:hypothetical protein
MKLYRILSVLIAVALAISACNLPSAQPTEQANPNAVFTAAAETVVAQLTQGALLNPTNPPPTIAPPTSSPVESTNTPEPVIPPVATSAPVAAPTTACDAAQFVTDVTIPDGTPFSGGATFVKTWRLKNIGTCTWNSAYALVFDSGTAMGGAASVPLSGTVAPGGSVDVSVNLQAPSADGTYRGFWGLTNASGARIPVAGGSNGKSFYVEIRVGSGTSAGTPDSGEGKFAVTSVGFNVARSGACTSMTYTITATITANKPGTVTYTWIRSDGTTGPTNSGSLSFDSAGSQTITHIWTFGGGGRSVQLYIDKPNHQYFGPANLNCP